MMFSMFAKGSKLSGLSSYLVTRIAIILFLTLSLLANVYGHTLLSAFLMFSFLLSLFSRIWGFRSLRNATVDLRGEHRCLFWGQSVEMEYTVKNDKLLPLIWLELLQDLPQNGCMIPDSEFERYEFSAQEMKSDKKKTVFRKKLSFIMSYRKVSWKSRYTAVRRGIYQIKNIELRSGDGFGLTQSQRTVSISSYPTFVVYPKIVPVKTELFYKNLWNCQSGTKGYFEDLTVLRGARAYQSTDSWKHINWRMAARQTELQVKLFETIMPKSVHFIIDGASFAGLSETGDELEETLSILASVILRLHENGMRCGISLPQTAVSPSVNLFPGEDEYLLNDVLFQISCFDGATALPVFDDKEISYAKDAMGQVYFITYDGNRSKCKSLLGSLDYYTVAVLTYIERENTMNEPSAFAGFDVKHLLSLKREGEK